MIYFQIYFLHGVTNVKCMCIDFFKKNVSLTVSYNDNRTTNFMQKM